MRTIVKKHNRVNTKNGVKTHVRETANMLRGLPKARDVGDHFGKRGHKLGTLFGKPLLKGIMTAGIGLAPALVRGHKQSQAGHAWDERRATTNKAPATALVKKRIAALRTSNAHSPTHFAARAVHRLLRGPRKVAELVNRGNRQRKLANGGYKKVHEKESWEHDNDWS